MMFLLVLARSFLGLLFAVAAISKLRSRTALAGFGKSLTPIRWLPPQARRVVTVVTPVLEAVVAVSMLISGATVGGLALAAVLLLLFSWAITAVLREGRTITCRCFGSGGGSFSPVHVVLNAAAAGLALAALLVSASASGALPEAERVAAVGAGALLALLFTQQDQIAYLFRSPSRVAS